MKRKPTDVPIILISQGRISKRDFDLGYVYFDESGKKLNQPDLIAGERRSKEMSFQPSSSYRKLLRKKRGEIIYRRPIKTCWELEKKIEASDKTPTQTYRMYLWTDLDKKVEAGQLMKDAWTTRTTFPEADSWIPKKVIDLDKPLEEDQIAIMSTYSHGEGYKYVDKWEVKTTEKTLSYTKKVPLTIAEKTEIKKEGFVVIKGHDFSAMRTKKSGGDRRVYTRESQRIGRKKR